MIGIPKSGIANTMYDPRIQDQFIHWISEAKVNLRFNTATYYIETKKKNIIYSILKGLGLVESNEIKVLHIITDQPGFLIGAGGSLLNKYKYIFIAHGIDHVIIREVRDKCAILNGMRRMHCLN